MAPRTAFASAMVICTIAITGVLVAQAPPSATPSLTVPMTTGTATISGVVTDSATHRPIANAVVALGPPSRGPEGQPVRQLTDTRGRFVFRGLPASDAYYINTSKFGYFDGQYGHSSPLLGSRVAVSDGQWLNIAIEMDRAASIGGTVVDEFGDPVVGVTVRLIAAFVLAGQKQLATGPGGTTDDRGAYRISALRAGSYYVSVPSPQHSAPASTSAARLSARPPGAPVPADFAQPPTMEVAGSLLYVGRSLLPGPRPDGRPAAYATVFHPGARVMASATPVTLVAGEERNGIDFRLEPVLVSRVSGRVVGDPESFADLTVRLYPVGSEEVGDGAEAATALVDEAGRFTFVNVPAGSYVIDGRRTAAFYTVSGGLSSTTGAVGVDAPPRPPTVIGSGFATTNLPSGPGLLGGLSFRSVNESGSRAYAGRASVTVDSGNVDDVVLQMQRGVTMTGRIVREGGGRGGLAALALEPARGRALGYARSMPQGPPAAQETFTIDGLLPGEYFLAALLSTGVIKSVEWNGEDYTDKPFDATTGRDFNGVVVTLVAEGSILGGIVRDARGALASNVAVLVFPVEPERWTRYGLQSPRIRTTDVTTYYRIQNLPAGDYFVVAVGERLADNWRDPEFLRRASAAAVRVSLALGERKGLDLVLSDVK